MIRLSLFVRVRYLNVVNPKVLHKGTSAFTAESIAKILYFIFTSKKLLQSLKQPKREDSKRVDI